MISKEGRTGHLAVCIQLSELLSELILVSQSYIHHNHTHLHDRLKYSIICIKRAFSSLVGQVYYGSSLTGKILVLRRNIFLRSDYISTALTINQNLLLRHAFKY
ncbi:hypothetical protein BpHYR1_037539 [Brachionus plicatilis]|uniref:Uncharacterized protein n=1 Tax=Brachionus plicatilis TaxID=10195 RepID=A0A3M7RZF4_BRAPC|nr:hypothetical protein BpHYR1_037539 [Brachionus plicatilis]